MNEKNNIVIVSDIDGTLLKTPQEEAWYRAASNMGILGDILVDSAIFSGFYAENMASIPSKEGAENLLSRLKGPQGLTFFENGGMKNGEKERYIASLISEKDSVYKALTEHGCEVYEDAKNLLIESRELGYKIIAVSASRSAERLLRTIVSKTGIHKTLYDMFDAHSLGKNFDENGNKVHNKYIYASNSYNDIFNVEDIGVIVLEDGPKGVKSAAEAGFNPVGICRKTRSGSYLSQATEMFDAGAKLAFYEEDLRDISIRYIVKEIDML
jgi:beta-phosphoglucomutase-like phosphatase (HAD superfamily)